MIYEATTPDPEATTIKVANLTPYMECSLRLVAKNVVGTSVPSLPNKTFQTIQAKSRYAPQNVTIRALEFTKLNVRWIPLFVPAGDKHLAFVIFLEYGQALTPIPNPQIPKTRGLGTWKISSQKATEPNTGIEENMNWRQLQDD